MLLNFVSKKLIMSMLLNSEKMTLFCTIFNLFVAFFSGGDKFLCVNLLFRSKSLFYTLRKVLFTNSPQLWGPFSRKKAIFKVLELTDIW